MVFSRCIRKLCQAICRLKIMVAIVDNRVGLEFSADMVGICNIARQLYSTTHHFGMVKQYGVFLCSDCGVRGMATGADIMCGSTKEQEKSSEPASESRITSLDLEELVNRPVVSVNPEKVHTVDPTPSTKQVKWWRPDPVTGAWVPEGSEGGITTSTGTTKTHSRITRIRSETTASLEDKRWWTSMEELPDMDRAPLK